MSVWKTVKNANLESNVDERLLSKALENLGAKLDNRKTVQNSFGNDTCDYGIFNTAKNRETSLGIRFTANRGIELVGDTWRSGLAGDAKQDALMDAISQQYAKEKYVQTLNQQGWTVTNVSTNAQGEIEITGIMI